MLAEVLAHKAEDRESMGKGAECVVCILLDLFCMFLVSPVIGIYSDDVRRQASVY